jgi:hypothetical protein
MMLWFCLSTNSKDCLRLWQQAHHPGEPWTDYKEPETYRVKPAETEPDPAIVREMKKKPNPSAEARK